MRLFIVRHAKARSGDPDELRPLTKEGERQARALGVRLATHSTPPAVVVASPLLRARQTAEAIARATGAQLRIDDRLAPGATASAIDAILADVGADPVATVGHQPDCSEITYAFTGEDPGFLTAGMAEIVLDR
jgi:phosphohistidine phosphatase